MYVACPGGNGVTVIDGATNTAIAFILSQVNVGSNPGAVAVDPVLDRAYVANWRGDSVSVMDGASNTLVETIGGVGTAPTGLGVDLLAHCHLGLGVLSRRADERQKAHEHLTAARSRYREMDMLFWLDGAERELAALQ